LVFAPRLAGWSPPPTRRGARRTAGQGPRAVPAVAPWRAPVAPWRARWWAPRLARRAARVVVVAAAPEVGRTSWRAWGSTRRRKPRQAWRAARTVHAAAKRWMRRQTRRAGRSTGRRAPSAPFKVDGGEWRAPCRPRRGAQGRQRGAWWSPAVVVATAARTRAHRAGRAAASTAAVPIAAVAHIPALLLTVVALAMSAAATERGVRPIKWPGSPALCGTTNAGGRAMPTRRRVRHGRRRGGRGRKGHVRVLASVLAGTRRGRRAPGTVAYLCSRWAIGDK